ncbi:MAG: RNA methyltransferase [Lachnospiraceae bacterium]|nr:RNA methyltransferase [Lachnospiraceae bacterium]
MAEYIELNGADDPALAVYAHLNEVQLKTIYEPDKNGLFIAESPNVILRALEAGYRPESMLMDRRHVEGAAAEVIREAERAFLAHRDGTNPESRETPVRMESPDGGTPVREPGEMQVHPESPDGGTPARDPRETAGGFPVYTGAPELLKRITGFELTRGVLCAMRRKPLPPPEEILKDARRIAVLENVQNPTNVGAVFRSAAALGMDAVLLTPGCSDPLYRRAARVSMGTVFQVPWTKICRTPDEWKACGVSRLHGYGFTTAALALKKDARRIGDPVLKEAPKLALLLGAEGDGLAADTVAAADYSVIIPMAHGVDSLNVAAASAVAFYEMTRGS